MDLIKQQIMVLSVLWGILGMVNSGLLYASDNRPGKVVESLVAGFWLAIFGPFGLLFVLWMTNWGENGWRLWRK